MVFENKKIKNVKIDYAKMDGSGEYVVKDYAVFFSSEKVRELLAMACEDVWPDGHYGDAECEVWSIMREVLRKENLK